MDEFEMTLALQFTPQTVFSMLGALVGSLISADVKRYGWRLTILFTIVASAVGGAMSEYLGHEKIWALFALNVPAGMVVGTTLDVVRIASPRMIEKLVNTVGDNTVNIVSNAVKNKLESVTGGVVSSKESTDTPTQDNNLSVDNAENNSN